MGPQVGRRDGQQRVRHGVSGTGTRRHIVEAFQEDPRYLVNISDRVAHLDVTGMLLVTERAGLTLGRWKPPAPDHRRARDARARVLRRAGGGAL